MTGIPSFTLKAEILLWDHSSANPTSPRLNFPAGLLQGQKFPIIPTHPNRTSGWQSVFQQIPQLQGGIEIVLEDTKGAISGSWAIVFMEDNRIFFYYGFKRFPTPLLVSNSKSSVGGSAKLDFVNVFQGDYCLCS